MTTTVDPRQTARESLVAKREFRLHLAIYVLVTTMLVVIWAMSGGGYFWPLWAMGGWGIGLAAHAYTVYFERPITEEDIEREMRRQRLAE